MKTISVVVCARNEEEFIEDCLKALKEQIIKPEIIVVDGHSNDNTTEIAKKYADIVVKDNKNGVGDARNIGWKIATGDIVAYTDADSRPPADWTKKIVENINGYIAVSGPLVAHNGTRRLQMHLKFWSNLIFRLSNKFRHPCLCGPNMAFQRDVLKDYPFQANLMEDIEIANRLRKVGKINYLKYHIF